MVEPLPNGVVQYLKSLQQVDCCTGLAAVHHTYANTLPTHRTVMRWFQRYPHLVVFPNFTLEGLGLVHAHVLVRNATPDWLRFPYAVEAQWLTENWCTPVLYLHCVIPSCQERSIRAWMDEFSADAVAVYLSDSGWQELQGEAVQEPPAVISNSTDLLRRNPLVIPVIFEHYNYRCSLSGVWQKVLRRVDRARAYVPRTRLQPVNGKTHVKGALTILERAGLFRQYVVGHAGLWSERIALVLVLAGEDADRLLAHIRELVDVSHRYRGTHADLLLLVGEWRLVEELPRLQVQATIFVLDKARTEKIFPVRWAYEHLFDPRSGEWSFDPEKLRAYMQVDG